tara:strand:+ start:1509 stop:2330 length:822 start_codon:yes stop_codon:yes gene_type:complete
MTGRHGTLDLEFELRNGRTELVHSQFHVPLQCFRPYYFDSQGRAYVYILTPTGGIVGGDHLNINVRLGPDCKVFLTTQAATKVYKTPGQRSRQSLHCLLEKNSSFEYFPDHTILFADADYEQSTNVIVASGATMVLADLFSAGRIARGEQFKFRRFQNEVHIRTIDHSIVIDKMLLQPEEHTPDAVGNFENYPYAGTIYISLEPARLKDSFDLIEALPVTQQGVSGHSRVDPDYGTYRVLTRQAEPLKRAIEQVFSTCRQVGLNEPWIPLRKC